MDKKERKSLLWAVAIFILLFIGLGVIIELDLWVPIQNMAQLEVIWLLSAVFIFSFLVIAAMLHHHKIAKGPKKSIFNEFQDMSGFGKTSLIIFVLTLCLMIVAFILTKTGHINLNRFEVKEEWIKSY